MMSRPGFGATWESACIICVTVRDTGHHVSYGGPSKESLSAEEDNREEDNGPKNHCLEEDNRPKNHRPPRRTIVPRTTVLKTTKVKDNRLEKRMEQRTEQTCMYPPMDCWGLACVEWKL